MNDLARGWTGEPTLAGLPLVRVDEKPHARYLPWLLRGWRIARRWQWAMLAIVAVAILVGLLLTLLTTPRYTAVATLEISRQQDRIVKIDDLQPQSRLDDQEFYQTQYSLLRSRTLAEAIARDLNLAEDTHFLAVFGIGGAKRSFLGTDTSRLDPAKHEKRMRSVVDALLGNVGVAPVRGSRIVSLSFTSADPAMSARIANAWTAHFIDAAIARRFDATAYARRFLEQRLTQVQARLEASERKLVSYAGAQRIINVGTADGGNGDQQRSERPLIAEDLETLNRSLADATAERIRAEARLQETGSAVSTEALTNDAITALRQKRAEADAEYAKLMVQFAPGYPPARQLASQITALDRSIQREESRIGNNLTATYATAAARERGLKQKVESLKLQLLDLRERSIQYNIDQRDVDTNRQLYEALLQRYKEIGVAGGVGNNNVAIVDPAQVPDQPSSPRLKINLLIALVLGLVGAAAAAIALEQIDDTIADAADFTDLLEIPLLGLIPKAEGEPLDAIGDRKSPVAEAYLTVATNLAFSTDHGVPKILAITSSRPQEGKSTTSYALAVTLTRTNRRVILVDCDMRSPSVHNEMGIANGAGLSNFLSGDDALDTLIQMSPDGTMAVMVAGPPPPSAAELLTGDRLGKLLEQLTARFDHVVLDCPPILGLADAPLIAARAEAVICAVEARGPRSRGVVAAISRLRDAHVNLSGGILTKFEAKKAHYGYGYEYGYGYGRDRASRE